jgi:phosphatidylglycerophosphate synthase
VYLGFHGLLFASSCIQYARDLDYELAALSRLQKTWQRYWVHARFEEWGDLVYARPLATAVLVLVGGIPGVTPDRLTLCSTLLRGASLYLLLTPPFNPWLVSALFLLAVAVDGADGQLARAQGLSSPLGSFLDKVLDLVWQGVFFLTLGWMGSQETNSLAPLLLASIAFAAQATAYYAYWVAKGAISDEGNSMDVGLGDLGDDRPPLTFRKIAKIQLYIFAFQESDLHLWIACALILGRVPDLCLFLAVTQVGTAAVRVVARGRQVKSLAKATASEPTAPETTGTEGEG